MMSPWRPWYRPIPPPKVAPGHAHDPTAVSKCQPQEEDLTGGTKPRYLHHLRVWNIESLIGSRILRNLTPPSIVTGAASESTSDAVQPSQVDSQTVINFGEG